jgi:hypothetical protein
VAVLSNAMWESQYGGRSNVLGSKIQIGSVVYTVIGVAAPRFVGLWPERPPAAFIPLTTFGAASATTLKFKTNWWQTYSWGWMSTMVRRKPEVPVARATADLTQAFVNSGLITLKSPRESLSTSGVTDWTAIPWPAGGSAAVLLKDPDGAAARDKVSALLTQLAADPDNGIASILARPAIAKMGGDPRA